MHIYRNKISLLVSILFHSNFYASMQSNRNSIQPSYSLYYDYWSKYCNRFHKTIASFSSFFTIISSFNSIWSFYCLFFHSQGLYKICLDRYYLYLRIIGISNYYCFLLRAFISLYSFSRFDLEYQIWQGLLFIILLELLWDAYGEKIYLDQIHHIHSW